MLLSPFADDIVDLVIEEGLKLLPLVQETWEIYGSFPRSWHYRYSSCSFSSF